MPLSLKQIKDVCMAYSGDHSRCRYLAQDDADSAKWYCLKKSSKRNDIDDEMNAFIREIKKKNQDPYKQGAPMGDNCSGFPILRHIEQGLK